MKNKELIGTLFALITALISGIAIPVNKLFLVDLEPVVFTAIRAIFIGIIFFVIISAQSKFDYSKFKNFHWGYLIAIGVIGGGLAFLLFFTGLKFTTTGRSAFLHKSLPLYIAVLAFLFLREKVTKKQAFALLGMFVGIFLIYFAKIGPGAMWSNPGLGDLLIIGATILWAVENVIARKAMISGETNFVVSFARMFIGAIFLFWVLLLLGDLNALLTLTTIQLRNLAISTLILFGYVFFWYWSIKLINVSKAAGILLLSPVISLILGVYFFSEPVPMLQLIGSALILIGAVFVIRIRSEFVEGV